MASYKYDPAELLLMRTWARWARCFHTDQLGRLGVAAEGKGPRCIDAVPEFSQMRITSAYPWTLMQFASPQQATVLVKIWSDFSGARAFTRRSGARVLDSSQCMQIYFFFITGLFGHSSYISLAHQLVTELLVLEPDLQLKISVINFYWSRRESDKHIGKELGRACKWLHSYQDTVRSETVEQ